MSCPACGHSNTEDATFCEECGARLQAVCPDCGQPVRPGAKFCASCGTTLTLAGVRATTASPSTATLPSSFANGRYSVKRFLGEGGKKRVYLVHDTQLDRDVAFSLIKTEGLDETGVERIRREARLMGRLGDHPHIVALYDLGDEAGQPYLVSQLMAGGDVEGLIAATHEHRLPLADTLRIADQVCQALEYAHEHGIIHRDLKPGNVWLTRDGTAKLGDFGLAVAIDKTRLSIAGMIVGTVGYMPPEQAMGRAPDARSDLYSLGAMLYELVTGRPPFLGEDPVAIISQHVNTSPVAPSWHNPAVPRALEGLILRLLEKDTTKRPESAEAVRHELATIAAGSAALSTSSEQLAAAEPANPLDRLAGGVFVGRGRELAELRAGLDAALSGQPQILLLVGEPGIGKTRLAEELATYAGMRGVQALWGRCYEWEGAPAYWPWVQIIRGYVHEHDPVTLRSELGPGASDIAQIVEQIHERLPGLPAPPSLEPEQARFRLFDSLVSFLRNASTNQPLMLVLDDLHWADKSSLLLLEFLVRELRNARLLIVGTYRDVEVGRRHPLPQTLAELARTRQSRRIDLRGLQHGEVAHFIRLSAGAEPPDALVETIQRETEGNPFFVTEVVRLLVSEGRLDRPAAGGSWSVSVPESVRDVVGRRLSQLSEPCNDVLAQASIIGREFGVNILVSLSGRPHDALLDLLDEAVGARLIQATEPLSRYRFSHALVQETLTAELGTAQRARLHAQVGAAIETIHVATIDTHIADLAYHYVEAGLAGNLAKAIDYSQRAGQQASDQLAWEQAVAHNRRALQLVEMLDPPDRVLECEVLLALGHAIGDAEASAHGSERMSTFRRAADVARDAGLDVHLARAVLGFAGHDTHGSSGGVEQLPLLEEGLRALGSGDSPLRAKLLSSFSTTLRWMEPGSIERARALSDDALAMARRLGDDETLVDVLLHRQAAFSGLEDVQSALAESNDLIEAGTRASAWFDVAWGQLMRGSWLLELGNIEEGDRAIERASAIAEQFRLARAIWGAEVYRSMRALMDGKFAESESRRERFRAMWPSNDYQYFPQLFVARRQQGRLNEISTGVQDRWRSSSISGDMSSLEPGSIIFERALVAVLDLEVGHSEQALALLAELERSHFTDVPPDSYHWTGAMALLTDICVELGDRAAAADLYRLLLPFGERNLMGGNCSVYFGAGHYYLGLLATLLGEWDAAARQYTDALRMNTHMGMWPAVAHTQYAWADMLARRDAPGDRERALELVDQALAAANDIGMVTLAGQALDLKVRVQGILKA